MVLSQMIAVSSYAQQDTKELANSMAPYYNINNDSVAIAGYDPTEYFISHKALKGSNKYQLTYKGATYYFVSDTNRALFKEHPESCLPQFGGYCAYGMGMRYGDGLNGNPPGKYPVNPTTFKIIDNKLYLFYNANGYNFLDVWESDETENLKRAHQRWKTIHQEE